MGRSAPEKADEMPEQADTDGSPDSRLSTLLEAIASERIPNRLLQLAEKLQQELSLRKQRRSPN